jgi:TetR/AcrR family transcriptional regulator, regulator of autoinduction and epiphytic fitness
VEEVLRRIAHAILDLHAQPKYLAFLRMVVAGSRQFPWIAAALAAVMDPQMERMERYIAQLTALGIVDCPNPTLAVHQLAGMLNELSLWPWLMGRKSLSIPAEQVVEQSVRMFLQHYRRPRSAKRR